MGARLCASRHSERRRIESRAACFSKPPRRPPWQRRIQAQLYDGIKHKPDTTFGNVKADVITDKEPYFRRGNFCSVIRDSAWRA